MTGMVIIAVLALLAGAALCLFVRPSPVLGAAIAATLLAGVAGYALQGHPRLAGQPTPSREASYHGDTQFALERGALLENLGDVGAWLNFADALQRAGMTAKSVEAMKVATKAFPDSPDLWVGLGNALVVHGDGFVSPAARLAFAHAAELAPDHPAPLYFLGLAWLQSGQTDEAIRTWQELRAKLPPGSPLLPEVDAKIAAARQMAGAGNAAAQ